MEGALSEDLPDQPEVIVRASRSIRKRIALCGNERWPLGTFLALGPVDPVLVLARALARFLFGPEFGVLYLDMGEYTEKWHITGLMARNGGLACPYFEGSLTDPVLRQPQTAVVLGNVDKMNSAGWPLLMDILDTGGIVDGIGRTISFGRSVVFLTTTVGHAEVTATPAFVADGEGLSRPAPLPLETRTALECIIPPCVLRVLGEVLPFRE
jgi:ATP-dependent Clp protease ATP-binding subunit ClpA